ncbi:MAG: bifunctional protein-serine/threonine kinase/phosphatase [Polaromonas sp.]|uniref:bifunctional protein-serine/threonine kinase/phosphatase n=1 Tax=Polaromonas sp. TaxID=1869339 RepID=UPI0025FC47B1|nr:bifunctional protein-serine/threonine kinase/phosphatase [Polaromonas sp.]MBI2725286.1 bifunctional protein-serine/threonine kinase/phosphatase [Polaromonas sp.]
MGELKISAGQYSDKGRKETNQDFHGICVPQGAQLAAKGIAIALADGISSSAVSDVASQYAVTGFLEDYYCTSDAWTVKTSAQRILSATNSWLYAQTQKSQYRYDKDKGYVCTLSAMVIKSTTAHIFHVGDSRIYRLRGKSLEQLTTDHRIWISIGQSYLGRALGIKPQLEIDYQTQQIELGDVFLLATDGVYEHIGEQALARIIHACNDSGGHLDDAAKEIVCTAYKHGSTDNLTAQVIRIDALPQRAAGEMVQQLSGLPLPPILQARMEFDGYTIIREVHGSSRSHIYLARDVETGTLVILKTPSIDLQGDAAYIERFLTEEWIARRISSAHVLRPCLPNRKRNFVYVVTEFIDGQTLSQWMIDNPKPGLEAVRGIVEQIAKGLRAFHRLEMLHQDLRPENIMIDSTGTVKIIDFGSASVASLLESAPRGEESQILGTVQYSAPEYFLGEGGTTRSDLFSLGVITYQMLTGRLPYGAEVAKSRTRAAQNGLRYDSVLHEDRDIPAWIDGVLRKAVHPNPAKRYEDLSGFLYDLRHPNAAFLSKTRQPLLDRNPVAFWKGLSLVLALAVVALLALRTFK